MSAPTVSVVIPTASRPQWLARAIRSAFDAAPDGRVEVIVVPNGPHAGWQSVVAEFEGDARVLVSPIDMPHANVARNHGLELARGEFVRFLDDDDHLLPEAAAQVDLLRATNADLCSGRVASLDQDGTQHGTVGFPESRDFVCAAVEQSGFTLPTGNLFRRARLDDCRWRPDVRRFQDNVWMVTLAGHREWQWVHHEREVGVWFQHDQLRTSTGRPGRYREPAVIGALFDLHDTLKAQGRLTPERAVAISRAVWHYAHTRFAFHPVYATRQALRAQAIARVDRPPHPIFERAPLRWLPLLLAEWLLLPARWAALALRRRDVDYRRRV